jgi:hypothetical protein
VKRDQGYEIASACSNVNTILGSKMLSFVPAWRRQFGRFKTASRGPTAVIAIGRAHRPQQVG